MTLPVHDPVLIVAIAMASFLLLPLITNRLRLPDIIGILIAGIIVGPHGVGLLERDETIQLLGTVGLLYLVFLAGLEVDLADLRRKRGLAISFGVITFLLPQIVGTVGGMLFFDFSFWTAVLLGSVFSSHSFLALLIAKRLGLIEREMTIAVIGGTVITDTLALLVLAVVAQSAVGDFGAMFLIRLLIQAGLFAAVVVFGLPLLGRWFFRHVNDGGAQFVFMMTVLFTCGFVAHLVGLEPIIGAFLAGLAMNRLVPHHGVLANRAFFIGNTLFVPFFLLSVGMLIDLRMVVSDLRTIEMAVFMTFTVTACKFSAAWLMRSLFGYGRNDAIVAWGLSLPQAATTLAVVLVGHDLGLFDDAILNATIVMVLVTCVLGPLLVQIGGRRIATDASTADADQVSEASSESDTGFQRILIPLANPDSSTDLLDLAATVRRPQSDEALLPLSIAGHANMVETSEKLLSKSVIHLAGAEVPVSAEIRVDPSPVNGILRAYRELRASSLIIGWSGPRSHWQRHFHLNHGLIDELIDETSGQLLVARLTGPLPVIERVILVLPPLVHVEPGFKELISDCKLLTKRVGASLTALGPEVSTDPQRDIMETVGPKCTIQIPDEQAVDLNDQIDSLADQHSLLIVVNCRAGSVSWNSAWHRQTTSIAHRQQAVSFIAAYPRILSGPVTQTHSRQVATGGVLGRARYLVDCSGAIDDLIRMGLPAQLTFSSDIEQHLLSELSALHEHVALVHTTAAGVNQPDLAVIVTRDAIPHGDLEIRVLLVLINPIGTGPQQHLDNLAAIARACSQAKRVEALLAAGDASTAKQALIGEL